MPGLRIYYVPPRLAGTVANWSGLENPDGDSWLLDRVENLKFNAIWFSPMQVTSQVEKTHEGKTVKGSLYAIRNHFALDREFSAEPVMRKRSSYSAEERARIDDDNKKHLQHFTAKAAEKGIRVFADLVFNHVAADHPLVLEENRDIESILQKGNNVLPVYKDKEIIGIFWREGAAGEMNIRHFKFKRNDDYALTVGGPPEDPWSDVAQVNYNSPEARRFFVDGDNDHKGYWKQVIDWHMEMGFKAFRCDVAYMVPPDCWKEIIAYARKSEPEAIFLAETLGGEHPVIEKMAQAKTAGGKGERPAFDLGMLSTYWWNFKDKWLPEDEHLRIQRMAQYGGAGFPDNHDTPETLAGHFNRAFAKLDGREQIVAALCLRNYAVSALACNSHYMQMGFELCKETQNHVFKGAGSPQEWRRLTQEREGTGHALDISEGVRKINELKERLGASQSRVVFHDNLPLKKGHLIKIHCSYVDIETGAPQAEVVLLLNTRPEKGAVDADLEKAFGSAEYKDFEREIITGKSAPNGRNVNIGDIVVLHRKPGKIPNASKPVSGQKPSL